MSDSYDDYDIAHQVAFGMHELREKEERKKSDLRQIENIVLENQRLRAENEQMRQIFKELENYVPEFSNLVATIEERFKESRDE